MTTTERTCDCGPAEAGAPTEPTKTTDAAASSPCTCGCCGTPTEG